MSSETVKELQNLVGEYGRRFGAGCPRYELRSDEEIVSLLKQALETGVPIPGWDPGEETSLRGKRRVENPTAAN